MKNDKRQEIIKSIDYTDEMETSYIDYAMSVIAARAIPDVRDGLKPVQRRTLYSMDVLGIKHDRPYKKSARIVGDTMGKYHPHGDSSIYEAMVHLSQPWVYNNPLVDGHGNFGSIEGDGPAAQRYTEARMSKLTEKGLLEDLNKNTVDFSSNFDETEKEPDLLPAKFPNILVSGTEGIAVGMATKIPTHNLGEVVDGTIAYIDNNKITIEELLTHIQGPDFATGGIISNKEDLLELYTTGTGKIRIRGTARIEPGTSGKTNIVISEIPQTMIGAIDRFMENVADLVRTKKAPDITDISNQSGKEGIRIVIEVRKGGNAQNTLNLLYKKAKLEDTFGVNMLAIKNQKPIIFSLKDILQEFVEFSTLVNTRKYTLLLEKEQKNKEVLDGLIQAIDMIDLIIEILRGSKSIKLAKECLMFGTTDAINFKSEKSKKMASKLNFTETQATAILEMRLSRLIGLELNALMEQKKEADKKIQTYIGILGSKVKMKNIIKKDLLDIKREFSTERKTELRQEAAIVLEKQEIAPQNYYFLMDRFGYVKLVDMPTYQRNEEAILRDFKKVFVIKNLDKLLVFTSDGKLHSIKALDIPLTKFKEKGVPLENLCAYTGKEKILLITALEDIINENIVFATQNGLIKHTNGSFFNVAKKTTDATKLTEDAGVSAVFVLKDETDIVIETENGMFLRFKTSEIPEKNKVAIGVKAIKLKEGDLVQNAYLGNTGDTFEYKEKQIPFQKIKLGKRDGQGTKSQL